MGHASTWKDPNTHITYKRGDKIVVTGTVYYSADGTSGTHGYYTKLECYFYSHYTATWTVKAPICIGKSSGTAWAFVKAESIVSGGTKESYKVTYNANGGTGAPSQQTKYYGTSLTLSKTIPTRTGYQFKNWNTAQDGSGTAYSAGGTYKGNKAVTLYAQWTKLEYPVTYNANGGTGAPSEQIKVYGTSLVLSKTVPTRTGYNFSYWSTYLDGTGVQYAPGDTYTENEALTLYAQWDPYKHTLKYDGNGGTGVPASQTKKYGSTINLSTVIPTRSGYAFLEWNTKKDGTGISYAPGQVYGMDQNGGTVTLYAQWKVDCVCAVKTPSGWKYGIAYVKVNGKWVQGEHVYIKVNGKWKLGVR